MLSIIFRYNTLSDLVRYFQFFSSFHYTPGWPSPSRWDFSRVQIYWIATACRWLQVWFAALCSRNIIRPSSCLLVWGGTGEACNCQISAWQEPLESLYSPDKLLCQQIPLQLCSVSMVFNSLKCNTYDRYIWWLLNLCSDVKMKISKHCNFTTQKWRPRGGWPRQQVVPECLSASPQEPGHRHRGGDAVCWRCDHQVPPCGILPDEHCNEYVCATL